MDHPETHWEWGSCEGCDWQNISPPRIQADYNKTVRPRKAAFEENLQKQLAEILNTDIANIQDLRTWEGSVEVSFNLVAPTNLDAGQQAQAMEQFSALINSGQLNLQDLDGNSLDVPSQCVQNCPVEIIGNNNTLYLSTPCPTTN